MSDQRTRDERRLLCAPPPDGVDRRVGERRRGRPPIADTRKHRLRIACNSEELAKFHLLATLNHDLKIATMARDLILDEVNAFLADYPRADLVVILRAMGKTPAEIDAILATL